MDGLFGVLVGTVSLKTIILNPAAKWRFARIIAASASKIPRNVEVAVGTEIKIPV